MFAEKNSVLRSLFTFSVVLSIMAYIYNDFILFAHFCSQNESFVYVRKFKKNFTSSSVFICNIKEENCDIRCSCFLGNCNRLTFSISSSHFSVGSVNWSIWFECRHLLWNSNGLFSKLVTRQKPYYLQFTVNLISFQIPSKEQTGAMPAE